MSNTIEPMVGVLGLGGGELVVILVVLLFPVVAVSIGIAIFLYVRATQKVEPKGNSFAGNPPPPIPPRTQVMPRKCPQCGAELRADIPEGLCPACLLQHGIATEDGAPLSSPPFTPPSLAELAKLFPQLEILEVIGQGGMGAVYKARQPALDRFVALKILAPRSGGDADFSGRFSREARALARLSHPNIVGVYDFGQIQRETGSAGETATLHYFIMEFVDGSNLRQVERAGKLSPREALQIIPQICAALQFAHDEGIVHRDIKPENVLLDKKGRVKIADFGLAKILGQEADFRLTGARDVMGTPHYMAPEQVEKPQEVDHRADIYSLGVVFYEMLTGELPLGKFDPPSHRVQIDVRLDEVVMRSLAKSPERRYQQVSEVKTELDTIASGAPVASSQPAKSGGPTPLVRAREVTLTVINVLVALLMVLTGWAANRIGMFFNALFLFVLIAVVVRVAATLWRSFRGTLEFGLWRRPLAAELGKHRWQVANRWLFWVLSVAVLHVCIVPAQFSADNYSIVWVLILVGIGVLIPLELLPARRLRIATNIAFALGSIFMAVQLASIYWPAPKRQGVVLSMPVHGEWLIVNGGPSSLINAHHNFSEQRDAVDMEKIVDGHERTGEVHQLKSYPSWGETVYAPVDGKISVVETNLDDNKVGETDREHPVGNHISIDIGGGRYVLMAHLQKGSVLVAPGDAVSVGQPLARCGNSGNTSHPHLHIQVQTSPRIFVTGQPTAKTFPVLFENAQQIRAGSVIANAPLFARRNDRMVFDTAMTARNDGSDDMWAPKTIIISRALSQSVGLSNEATAVIAWTDTTLRPGETLSALVRKGDEKMSETSTMWVVNWQPGRVGSSYAFNWYFGGILGPRFNPTDGESALAQLTNGLPNKPIALTPNQPEELFSVTNKNGEIMTAFLKFQRVAFETPKPGAKVEAEVQIDRFNPFSTDFPQIDCSAKLPAGYILRATANAGSANTVLSGNPYGYRFSWQRPFLAHTPKFEPIKPGQIPQYRPPPPAQFDSFEQRQAQSAAFKAHLQELQDKGSFTVILDEPKLLFSVTNGSGDVFQGFLELAGPETKVSTGGIVSITNPTTTALPNQVIEDPSTGQPAGATSGLIPPRISPATGLPTTSDEQTRLIEAQRAKFLQAPTPPPGFVQPMRPARSLPAPQEKQPPSGNGQ